MFSRLIEHHYFQSLEHFQSLEYLRLRVSGSSECRVSLFSRLRVSVFLRLIEYQYFQDIEYQDTNTCHRGQAVLELASLIMKFQLTY